MLTGFLEGAVQTASFSRLFHVVLNWNQCRGSHCALQCIFLALEILNPPDISLIHTFSGRIQYGKCGGNQDMD